MSARRERFPPFVTLVLAMASPLFSPLAVLLAAATYDGATREYAELIGGHAEWHLWPADHYVHPLSHTVQDTAAWNPGFPLSRSSGCPLRCCDLPHWYRLTATLCRVSRLCTQPR